jgi:excisionase family DNA binding protein
METLKTTDVAKLLHVSSRSVREWAKTGRLRAFKIGARAWHFTSADLERFTLRSYDDLRRTSESRPSRTTADNEVRHSDDYGTDYLQVLSLLGFSHKEIAAKLAVPESTISRWSAQGKKLSADSKAKLHDICIRARKLRIWQAIDRGSFFDLDKEEPLDPLKLEMIVGALCSSLVPRSNHVVSYGATAIRIGPDIYALILPPASSKETRSRVGSVITALRDSLSSP